MPASANDLIAAIITGLVGSGITLGVERSVRALNARSIERKFPVAGTYLTKYSDKGKIFTDMVRLRQSGAKIKGESILSSENPLHVQKWIFEGEVKKEGYIQGNYRPETPFDKGFGAFFCKFGKDGDMQGYWLGKDADESEIQWGDYKFMKQPQFTISNIEPTDIVRVLEIAEKQLGDAYIDESHLKTSDENVALCARVHATVVAFATARLVTSDQFLARITSCVGSNSAALRPLERRIDGETKIGFIASAATDLRFSGRGLGADLIGRCIEGLEQRGAKVIAATAWVSRNGAQAGSILAYRGFQKLLDVPKYWEKDSLAHGYSCPTCGAPPCQCTAVIYIRNCHSRTRGFGEN